MTTSYTTILYNHLGRQRMDHLISWEESSTGPTTAPLWKMTCKVSGDVLGTATAHQKSVAKDQASKEALTKLGWVEGNQ